MVGRGLIRYLPAQAQDLLFERILSLSAPGSWLASNVPGRDSPIPRRCVGTAKTWRRCAPRPPKVIDAEVTDFDELWYPEERTPVDSWLRERGWDVLSLSFPELMARYGRSIPAGHEDSMSPTQFISARLTA